MKTVAGYVRVSRVAGREGASFQSPAAQEDAIRAHARARRLRLTEVVHELDVSGGTMKRPKLRRIVDAIERGELGGIVVWRIDRFARTLLGGLKTLEEIHEAGGFVQTVEGGIDTSAESGAMGQLQLNLLLTLAEWERGTKAEGLEAAKQRAVARGAYVAPAPVGYVRLEKGAPLVLDPEKGDAVRAAFELRSTGAGYGDVVALLDRELPGGPSGRGAWNRGTVTRLLRNRAYLGEAAGANTRRPDAHPEIVSQEVFDTVGALARRGEGTGPGNGAKSLLAGLVRCGACGHALDRNKVGGRYIVYRCRGRSASGICEAPTSAMADKLEALVEEAVKERLAGPTFAVQFEQADDADVAEIHARLAAARAKREPFEDADFVAALGLEAAKRALARVDDEITVIEEELANALSRRGPIALGAIGPTTAAALLDELVDTYDLDDPVSRALYVTQMRDVLGAFVDQVVVSRGKTRSVALASRVTIVWRGDGAPLARPSRGRSATAA